MNLILLFPEDFAASDRVVLRGRRAGYVRTVHRAALGSTLRVGLVDDRLGSGRVTRLDDDAVELAVSLTDPPPDPLPLIVLLALPRPKSMQRVLQMVAALGVKHVVLMNSWRVEKSYWLSPQLLPAAMRANFVLGLEQASDTRMPTLTVRPRLKPFVEDEVAALARNRVALIAHPAATERCPRAVNQSAILAIGPEGGFIAYEIDLFTAHGFRPVSLGARRLRVEQVIPLLIGRLF